MVQADHRHLDFHLSGKNAMKKLLLALSLMITPALASKPHSKRWQE